MADHEIQIVLRNGWAVPLPSAGEMKVGQTVRYSSPDGKAEVQFDGEKGSPFGKPVPDVIPAGETRTLTTAGYFRCKCSITVGSTTVGWSDNPESGGDHDVKP